MYLSVNLLFGGGGRGGGGGNVLGRPPRGYVLRVAARCGWSRFGAKKSSANEEISKLRTPTFSNDDTQGSIIAGLNAIITNSRVASRFIAISTVDHFFTGYKQRQSRIILNGILAHFISFYLDPFFIPFL